MICQLLTNGIFTRRHGGGNAGVLRNRGNARLFVAVRSSGVAPWWHSEIQIPVVHGSSSECPSESAHHNADRTTDQSNCGRATSNNPGRNSHATAVEGAHADAGNRYAAGG